MVISVMADEYRITVDRNPYLEERLVRNFLSEDVRYDKVFYADDEVLEYMLSVEDQFLADPYYLQNMQGGAVKPWMRRDVVEWIMEIIELHNFHAETLALSVNFFDRVLSMCKVSVAYVQLVAAAALLIASKLKETNPISLKNLSHSIDYAYTVAEITKMESIILAKLQWEVNAVVPHEVLEQIMYRLQYTGLEAKKLRKYTQAFIDMAFTEYEFLKYKPSLVAAAGLICSLEFCGFSGHRVRDISSILNVEFEYLIECRNTMKDLYFSIMPEDSIKYITSASHIAPPTHENQEPRKDLNTPPNVAESSLLFTICED
eukprot:Nk52_evm19s284 gene=Nk52_evmTU19s284